MLPGHVLGLPIQALTQAIRVGTMEQSQALTSVSAICPSLCPYPFPFPSVSVVVGFLEAYQALETIYLRQ